ncbi:MAG: ABC transporter permease [Aeromonadaceae bacterium]
MPDDTLLLPVTTPGVTHRTPGSEQPYRLLARLRRAVPALWLLPLLLILAIFTFAPLGWILHSSLLTEQGWSLSRFHTLLASPFYRQAFGNSLFLSIGSSLAGLLLATLGAASLRRVGGPLQDGVVAIINMTSNMAGVPLAFAFIVILGTNGAITLLLRQGLGIEGVNLYSMPGLLLLYTYFQIPLAWLLIYPAFDNLDHEWRHAAALLGASRTRYLWHIALPVLAPALLGTFILLFANSMGAYASAYALTSGNYNLLTVRIASLVAGDLFLEPETAAALSVLLMGVLVLVAWANQLLLKRLTHGR